MAFRADDISINTLVGNGSFIKGNLTANGFIRIDGDLDGDLTTDGAIIVGEKARIKGNLVVKSAIIGGVVLGDVSATESVKLLSSSVVGFDENMCNALKIENSIDVEWNPDKGGCVMMAQQKYNRNQKIKNMTF